MISSTSSIKLLANGKRLRVKKHTTSIPFLLQAIEEAEHNDRMHLRTTYFNYARHAEAEEETQVAINCYTKSGTHHMQVPRMLFDNPLELEDYVMKSHDR